MSNLVNISAVQENDSFVKAMMMYVNLDIAREELKDAEDSGFGCLRAGVVKLYTAERARAAKLNVDMDYLALAGEFQVGLSDAEDWLRNPVCPKNYKEGVLPNSYKVAKSTLLTAIKNQFDFFSSPQVGSSKLSKWNSDIKAAAEKAERQKEIEAAAKRNKDSGTGPAPAPKPGEQGNPEGEQAPAPAAAAEAPEGTKLDHLSAEQVAKALEMLNRLNVIAGNDSQKVDNLLRGWDSQTSKAFANAMAALAA